MGLSLFEAAVRRAFEWYGRNLLYRLRWPLVIIPLLISFTLATGFVRLNELRLDDPSYVFTPTTARWRTELKTFTDNWPLDENKFLPGKSFETKRFINILIRAKDGGNILRKEILQEIKLLNEFIVNNITISTNDKKYNLTYQDLCLSYDLVCGNNEHIEMLLQRHRVSQVIDLSYPRGGNKDTPVYLGSILGDIVLSTENKTVTSANITQLVYFLKQESTLLRAYSSDFSYAVEKFLLKVFDSQLIEVAFTHYQSLQDGLDENAERFAPNFVFSFSVLTVYSLICAFCLKRRPKRGIDWIRSKPWLACAGLFSTLMAIMSGFGCLLLLGVNYNVINTIIPFLIIAIGIDDMFIMNACWEASGDKQDIPTRLSQTLAHAGVAVSITNVTDILSFGIGCLTDLPGIQLFCLYTCVTITFCYVYQFTYFCGLMAIIGNAEKEKRHCLFFYRTFRSVNVADLDNDFGSQVKQFHHKKGSPSLSVSSAKASLDGSYDSFGSLQTEKADSLHVSESSPPPPYQSVISSKASHSYQEASKIVQFFGNVYGPILLSTPCRVFCVIVFGFYLAGSYYGCINFREGLNPGNLVTNDHYISQYFKEVKSLWKMGPQLHVAIMNPPDLTSHQNRKAILDTVAAFENTPYTLGREGTMFFLLEYYNYLDQLDVEIEDTERLWHQKLKSWLKYTGGAAQWASDIHYKEDDPDQFASFRFQVAMKNIVEPNDHKHATAILREIADRQKVKVEVFHEMFPFADQYLIILPATIQNVIISLLCMTGVSLLMVPSLPSGLIIFLAIISINVGVFGYMTLWGVNLDAVSMISLIMSIGFAVDLSAHIVYAFVTSHGDTHQRVIGALEALGWPIFQGASSTIAGISILYTVDAYIILTFFKTIWLTMVIGAVHGLFFIPVFLSFFPVSFFRIPKSTELH